MEKETVEQVAMYLDKIGEKVGVTFEQMWPFLVKQAFIEGLFSTILFVISTYFYGLFIWKFNKKYSGISDECTLIEGIGLVICGFIWFILLVVFICCFLGMINPEYYAIKEILSVIK